MQRLDSNLHISYKYKFVYRGICNAIYQPVICETPVCKTSLPINIINCFTANGTIDNSGENLDTFSKVFHAQHPVTQNLLLRQYVEV